MSLTDGLPSFLHFSAPRPFLHINRTDNGFTVEGRTETFEDLVSAYDFVRQELGMDASFSLPTADNAFPENEVFYIQEDTRRVIMSYNPNHQAEQAQEEYTEFLGIVADYRAESDAFYPAYQFVSRHPVFWYYVQMGNGDLSWDYEGFTSAQNPVDVYLSDERDEEPGRVRVLIEPVIYVDTQRGKDDRVLDTNLVVIDDTFESAIIALAERIDRYYDETGEARAGVANTAYTQHLADTIGAADN